MYIIFSFLLNVYQNIHVVFEIGMKFTTKTDTKLHQKNIGKVEKPYQL